MVLTIIIALISLVGLLVIHELGHFLLAKKFGAKVEEFGIGYPPRIFGKKIGETIYSLNLLPFGAFVKIYGEEGGVEDYRSFSGKPLWQRALIIVGGVLSFWIVAAILLSILMGLGTTTAITDEEKGNLIDPKVQIVSIASGSPAEAAGIEIGDTVKELKINQERLPVNKVKEVQEFTEINKGEEIILTIERGKELFDISLIPRVSPPEGEGAMGIGLVRTAIISYPWYEAPFRGIVATWNLTVTIVQALGELLGNVVTGRGVPSGVQIVGPIGIFQLFTQFAQLGAIYFLRFIAVIAVYLAIFNILPIPALDGGKLVFLGIEAVRKKPISPKIEQRITATFFALLILIMIWVTIKDIIRIF